MADLQVTVLVPADLVGATGGSAVLRVALLDTSLADALHPTVAETQVPGWSAGSDVTLAVPDGALDPRHRYSLWAHLDRDGDGRIAPGDLITTADVPVGAHDLAAGRRVEVELVPV